MERFPGGEEIALAKGVEVAAVEGEKPEPPVQGVEFVEIDCEKEDAVDETMARGQSRACITEHS